MLNNWLVVNSSHSLLVTWSICHGQLIVCCKFSESQLVIQPMLQLPSLISIKLSIHVRYCHGEWFI